MEVAQRGTVLSGSDIAIGDQYGIACALSGDGSVLAVGADSWEGASNNQGGVYIYDKSGASWVQRGAVLVADDPASNGKFGHSVALSDSGTVLAVGSVTRGTYVYDWIGGAWVQRGTKIASTIATKVALSADGDTLVVGVPNYSAVYSNGGRVLTYGWNGTAWVESGTMILFSTASAFFGWSVALSANASVLAVGATGNNGGGGTSSGSVFIYDWDGGGWTLRLVDAHGTVVSGNFGSGMAISGDASTLVVGEQGWYADSTNSGRCHFYDLSPSALTLANTIVSPGTPESAARFGCSVAIDKLGRSVVVGEYLRDTPVADGGALYTFDGTLFTGVSIASTLLTVSLPVGGPSIAATRLTVENPHGASVASTKLTMTASGPSVSATLLSVIDPAHTAKWTARCLLDGVDVSARLVGQASVTCDEGAARIAILTILPGSGVVTPLDYVGKPITLDYVLVVGGTQVPRRLFTGRVDTPEYNPATTLITLTCVDDLQNRVALLDRSVIDGLVGGKYTEAVQGEVDDNWDYAKALLTTRTASLDAGASGGMRVTPWEIDDVWATFTEENLKYDRSTLSLPQRSRMVNTVNIEFDYRYSRLRQRYTTLGWSGTQIDMAPCGYQYPTQQDILGAASGSGWTVTLGAFYPAPAAIPHSSGGFIYPDAGSIDMAILHLTQRHSQTVTETYSITVSAPESAALNGELPHALRGALASQFDGYAWESALDLAPLMPAGGEVDYAPDAERADADYAIETLLDQAKAKILSTHRGARVGNAVLCNPDLDLDKRITIDTAMVEASGKVSSVVHVLDFAAGSAISQFEIAIFGAGGAGIITPDTLATPDPPEEAVETQNWPYDIPSLFVNTYGTTPYSENLMGLLLNPPETILVEDVPGVGSQSFPNTHYVSGSYPVTGFRVQMPGVDDADRNPITKQSVASYSIIVPQDTMTFTVP